MESEIAYISLNAGFQFPDEAGLRRWQVEEAQLDVCAEFAISDNISILSKEPIGSKEYRIGGIVIAHSGRYWSFNLRSSLGFWAIATIDSHMSDILSAIAQDSTRGRTH